MRHYTTPECLAMLNKALTTQIRGGCSAVHADHCGQAICTLRPFPWPSNIGTTAYCRSTVARRFNAGDFVGACNGFLSWSYGRSPGQDCSIAAEDSASCACRRRGSEPLFHPQTALTVGLLTIWDRKTLNDPFALCGEHGATDTGLLDADGNTIWRAPNEMGFVWRRGQ